MANSSYELLELRVVIEPERTPLYVRCSPDTDGGVLVGGWYRRVLTPSDGPALDVLLADVRSSAYLVSHEWTRGAPPP